MALADAVEGARHSGQAITWLQGDGVTALDLTGATITGYKKNVSTDVVTALDGTMTITSATAGEFTWTYGANDVADPGKFTVQFLATYGAADIEKTILHDWTVINALDDEVGA